MPNNPSADKTPEQPLPESKPTPQPSEPTDNASSGSAAKDLSMDKAALHIPPINADSEKLSTPADTRGVSALDAGVQPVSQRDNAPGGSGQQNVIVSPISLTLTEALPDIENPYILSGEVDRARLVAQSRLFRTYVEKDAKQLVGENLKSILDLGCGEGQFTMAFARLYPGARVLGIDRDELAISAARSAAKGMPNVEFEVGDIQEHLPAGPFDLVFESLVLLHVPKTAQTVQHVFSVLKPGGYFWSKEFHPMIRTAVNHPAYTRLMGYMDTTMSRIGGHIDIAVELPGVLAATGFTNIRKQEQILPLGNINTEARIIMAVNLGAIYNARKLVSKMLQVPEGEIERSYKELVDSMMAPGGPKGEYLYIDTVAQRPA